MTPLVEFHHDPQNGGFFTTALFWECECEEDYLHTFTQPECPACEAKRDESPDARLAEVLRCGAKLDEELVEIACQQAGVEHNVIPF